jgi:GNAT superfamily N-acetyltransferase
MKTIQFGICEIGKIYTDRPGSYGVIFNNQNKIGVVKSSGSYFLHGGGVDVWETENDLTRGCKPYGIIENVVTHCDYHSKGVGKGLLQFALSVAWGLECYKVMLMTGSNQDWVHQFYEDAGFQKNVKTAFVINNYS